MMTEMIGEKDLKSQVGMASDDPAATSNLALFPRGSQKSFGVSADFGDAYDARSLSSEVFAARTAWPFRQHLPGNRDDARDPDISLKVGSHPSTLQLQDATALSVSDPLHTHIKILVAGSDHHGKARFIDDFMNECVERINGRGNSYVMPSARHHFPDARMVNLAPLEWPGHIVDISLMEATSNHDECNSFLCLARLMEYISLDRVKDYRAASLSWTRNINNNDNTMIDRIVNNGRYCSRSRHLGGRPARSVLMCLYFLPCDGKLLAEDLTFMSALSEELPLLPVMVPGAALWFNGVGQPICEEWLTVKRRELVAAMRDNVRNGKPAPIQSLELTHGVLEWSTNDICCNSTSASNIEAERKVLVYGGNGPTAHTMSMSAGAAHSNAKMFLQLLQSSLGPLLRCSEEKFKNFCQRYEASDRDMTYLLSERLEPYDGALKRAIAARATAPTGIVVMPSPTRCLQPSEPMTPEQVPVAAAKLRQRRSAFTTIFANAAVPVDAAVVHDTVRRAVAAVLANAAATSSRTQLEHVQSTQ